MENRTCDWCGVTFEPLRRVTRTCSRECRVLDNRKRQNAKRAAAHPMINCAGCGESFRRTRVDSTTCSPRCRSRAKRRRASHRLRCEHCARLFVAGRSDRKWCSDRCVVAGRAERRKVQRQAVLTTRECVACGVGFRPLRGDPATCSNRCGEWHRRHPGVRRVTTRRCRWCREMFAPATQAQSFCTRRCLNGSHRRSRRAMEAGNPGSVGVAGRDWARLVARARGRCYYCGAKFAGALHMDHVAPLSLGGRHAIGNVVPACQECNLSKGARPLSVWRYRHARPEVSKWLSGGTLAPATAS